MQILVTTDATTLGYWLNWRVVICAVWVLAPMLIASCMICKYEPSDYSKSEERITHQGKTGVLYDDVIHGDHGAMPISSTVLKLS